MSGWSDYADEHRCDFPEDTPPEDRKEFWQCPTCLTIYSVSTSAWTGWWSPDSNGEYVSGTNKYGTPTMYCMDERWVTCSPGLTFAVKYPGIFGKQYTSYGMDEKFPGPKPNWIAEQEKNPVRPLWRGKEIPGQTKKPVDTGGLSRLASPGDNDLPEVTTNSSTTKKKRKWLHRE